LSERTPTAPFSGSHGFAALVVEVVPLTVTVVNEQSQVTLRLVAPLTVAVNVTDWLTINTSEAGVTKTVTVFAPLLLPPQPGSARTPKARAISPKLFQLFQIFVTTFPPA